MFVTTQLTLFIAATLALLIVPGPTVLYIIAPSLEQGRIAGLISVLGVSIASLVHVAFARLGILALLVKSATAFSLVKYLGAMYLIYLGLRTLTNKTRTVTVLEAKPLKLSRIFWQGFIVNLLNPKTALFFLAFLPQFVNPGHGAVWLQICILGMIFVGLAIVNDGLLAMVAGTVRPYLSGHRLVTQMHKDVSGSIYIALGITTALSGNGQHK